ADSKLVLNPQLLLAAKRYRLLQKDKYQSDDFKIIISFFFIIQTKKLAKKMFSCADFFHRHLIFYFSFIFFEINFLTGLPHLEINSYLANK
ncbi:MAG: hypothetical protein WCO54_12310, partial [Bacteroidota bacterium]